VSRLSDTHYSAKGSAWEIKRDEGPHLAKITIFGYNFLINGPIEKFVDRLIGIDKETNRIYTFVSVCYLFEINMCCARISRICMPYSNFLAFIVYEILAFIGMDGQIDRRTWLVQLVLNQEYINAFFHLLHTFQEKEYTLLLYGISR